jgi:hypothetical protein
MKITDKRTDYSLVNVDLDTGIHYGVISQNHILEAWCESSLPYYGEIEGEEIPDCSEPLTFYVDDGEYMAECDESGDIFVTKSPYYTRCRLCSPCAPNAGYLLTPDPLGVKAYCFGTEWFDDGIAPYPVYEVKREEKEEVQK